MPVEPEPGPPSLGPDLASASDKLTIPVTELMAVVDLFSGFNKLVEGLRVEPDEKPWYG